MKIAICDDNHIELLQIAEIVKEFIEAHISEHDISYSAFPNGSDLLAQTEKGQRFDILLLDIVMPLMNGIQLAQEIRKKNNVSKIIFLTSAPEYAVDSYSVDAYYYLLKPVKKELLLSLLEEASAEISHPARQHILVKSKGNLLKISLDELQYAEVIRRTVCFHLKNTEVVESACTMIRLESELLSHERFIKPHRSYIMNMQHIRNLSPEGIITASGALIPVSRNVYRDVKQAYINFSFNGGKAEC